MSHENPSITPNEVEELRNKVEAMESQFANLADIKANLLAQSEQNDRIEAQQTRIIALLEGIGATAVVTPEEPVAALKPKSEATQKPETTKRFGGIRRKLGVIAVAGVAALGVASSLIGDKSETASADSGTTTTETTTTPPATTERSDPTSERSWNTSIDNFTKKYDKNSIHAAAKDMFGDVNDFDNLDNSNAGNRQVSLKSFDKNAPTEDVAQSHFAGIINAPEYSATILNGLEGKDGSAPRSDTHEERVKLIGSIYMNKDTEFSGHFRWNGLGKNHSTDKETKDVSSKVQNLDGVRMLQINPANSKYKTIYIKIGGGADASGVLCDNLVQRVIVKTPETPVNPTPNPQNPGTPNKPTAPSDKPEKPTKVVPPTKTPETPTSSIPPKKDTKTTPAGVPGHNGGTPDVAGQGPAGQTPGPNGYLPTETKPAAPPSNAPTPTPQVPSSETQNRPPAETGTGPTSAPEAPVPGTSNGTGQGGTVSANGV